MKKALLTFGLGDTYKEMVTVTSPAMMKYAEQHGYDFIMPEQTSPRANEKSEWARFPSWQKILFMEDLANKYDQILWLDCDIVIRRGDKDIADEVEQDSLFGISLHHAKPYGICPNCGVWFLNTHLSATKDLLKRITGYEPKKHPLTLRTWEQGALILEMGGGSVPGNPIGFPVFLPATYPFKWSELHQDWNSSTADIRGIPDTARFVHASTYTKDKAQMLRNLQ